MRKIILAALLIGTATLSRADNHKNVVDYVSTLVGTQSKFELSTGNTYPAVALPWGMNFWVPQTGKKGAIATSKHGNISHATLTI